MSAIQNEPFNKERTKIVQSESNGKCSNFSTPATYSIHVEGLLDESWSERLAGMYIKTIKGKNLPPVTTLSGRLKDQAELLGVLNALYNLHITLVAVERLKHTVDPEIADKRKAGYTRTHCKKKEEDP